MLALAMYRRLVPAIRRLTLAFIGLGFAAARFPNAPIGVGLGAAVVLAVVFRPNEPLGKPRRYLSALWRRTRVREPLHTGLSLFVWITAAVMCVVSISKTWPGGPSGMAIGNLNRSVVQNALLGNNRERFVLTVLVAIVAVHLTAVDWRRRSFVIGSLGLVLGIVASMVRIGWDHPPRVELTEAIAEFEAIDTTRKHRIESLDQAAVAARDRLEEALQTVRDPDGVESLIEVVQTLSEVLKDDPSKAGSYQGALDSASNPAEDEAIELLRQAAQEAIATATARSDFAPSPERVLRALAKDCNVLERRGIGPSACDRLSKPEDTDLTSVTDITQVALSEYRFDVTADDADQAELEEIRAGQRDRPNRSVIDAFSAAPSALFESDDGQAAVPVPGSIGWLLITSAGLTLWSWEMRRNARQLAGPVELADDEVNGELRVAVLQNLPEPSATPGGEQITSVTSLIELAPGPAGNVAKAIGLVAGVLGTSYGYVIESDHVEVAEPNSHRVLVRVRDRVNRRTLAVQLLENTDLSACYTSAGLWASGWILGRSSRIPSWAKWSSDTAVALAGSSRDTAKLAQMEQLAHKAPSSGLMLHRLASAYEMEGRSIQAIATYLRAIDGHPMFEAAYYRLAGNLTMLATNEVTSPDRPPKSVDSDWSKLSDYERRDLSLRLKKGCAAINIAVHEESLLEVDVGRSTPARQTATYELARIASEIHGWLQTRNARSQVAFRALWRSERDDALQILMNGQTRKAREEVAWSASLIAAYYTRPLERDTFRAQLIEAAANPFSWWQVSYNAACLESIAQNPKTSIGLLRQCLSRPGSEQLSLKWFSQDPDLFSVRTAAPDEIKSIASLLEPEEI